MNIEVFQDKIVAQYGGKTAVSTCQELIDLFNKADEFERKILLVAHFGQPYFPVLPKQSKKTTYVPPQKKDLWWDEDAQRDLDDILGADPYTMFY